MDMTKEEYAKKISELEEQEKRALNEPEPKKLEHTTGTYSETEGLRLPEIAHSTKMIFHDFDYIMPEIGRGTSLKNYHKNRNKFNSINNSVDYTGSQNSQRRLRKMGDKHYTERKGFKVNNSIDASLHQRQGSKHSHKIKGNLLKPPRPAKNKNQRHPYKQKIDFPSIAPSRIKSI